MSLGSRAGQSAQQTVKHNEDARLVLVQQLTWHDPSGNGRCCGAGAPTSARSLATLMASFTTAKRDERVFVSRGAYVPLAGHALGTPCHSPGGYDA
eukprot:scaffold910_cov396-Prasinococcus_capsulatus_cf.AAC.45